MSADRSGVLPVDKPEGPTSHDVVALARRALGTRRIGHTGTLDPFASGLLLLCVGRATRLAEYLVGLPKTYVATVRLGTVTDTADPTGEVIGRSEGWRDLDEETILAAFAGQLGRIRQLPPAFSAKRVRGERAYDRARRGETVELAPVEVEISRLDVLRIELPDIDFEVECSSGTYVRAIGRDVGEALGVGGHLTRLRRMKIGQHDVDAAVPVAKLDDPDAVRAAWLEPLAAVAHLPRLEVDGEALGRLRHGGAIAVHGEAPPPRAPVAIVHRGALAAIGEVDRGRVRPRKVFHDA